MLSALYHRLNITFPYKINAILHIWELTHSQVSESCLCVQRDSWEQAGMEPTEGLCGNGLAPASVEPSSPSQYRSSSRSSSMGSSQFYSLHTLDDMPYHSSFQLPSSFPCPTYSEHVAKLPALSTEDTENAPSALNDMLPWVKEDATGVWSHCEIRRTFWCRAFELQTCQSWLNIGETKDSPFQLLKHQELKLIFGGSVPNKKNFNTHEYTIGY